MTRRRLPVAALTRGYTVFSYRQNGRGQWEVRGPNAIAWSRVRTSWPEATVRESIQRLVAQGFTRSDS